ncbi:hypothetical protein, partial [Borreliella garinii]|uniref:hypothetical protein n=1 Tax=Borreliella garinii TaxID=29519 RepID=UPI001AEF850D
SSLKSNDFFNSATLVSDYSNYAPLLETSTTGNTAFSSKDVATALTTRDCNRKSFKRKIA